MIKVLTAIAALVTIAAASLLIYIHSPWSVAIVDRAQQSKDQTQLAAPAPRAVFPDPGQQAAPVIVVPSQQAAPTTVVEQPTEQPAAPRVVKHKKKKAAAVRKLKSKWVAPKAQPFSLGDLFNVR